MLKIVPFFGLKVMFFALKKGRLRKSQLLDLHRAAFSLKCIFLIAVRVGVVDHPQRWPFCGYNEIQDPPRRYRIIDLDSLVRLMGCTGLQDLQATHKRWVEETLQPGKPEQQNHWTESIALGSKSFIEEVKKGLGFRARGRSIAGSNDHFELREDIQFWKHFFTGTRSK